MVMWTKPIDLKPLEFAQGVALTPPKDRERLVADMKTVGLKVYRIAGREFVSDGQWQQCLARVAIEEVRDEPW